VYDGCIVCSVMGGCVAGGIMLLGCCGVYLCVGCYAH
jgi:hypothetical protein